MSEISNLLFFKSKSICQRKYFARESLTCIFTAFKNATEFFSLCSFDEVLQRVLPRWRRPSRDRQRDPTDDGPQGQEGSPGRHHR